MFISTAVAKTLGWEYECQELNRLRRLRDTFMHETPEREAEVKEYYELGFVKLKHTIFEHGIM